MVVHYSQYRLGNQKTQVPILPVPVQDLKHPKNGSSVDNFLLVLSLMFDVEVNHVEQQIQYSYVAAVEQSLEDKHEELFVQPVQNNIALVTLIFAQVYTKLSLFLSSQWII